MADQPEIISRDEAAAKGWTLFFTGKPCKWGHIAKRFVSNGGCVDCHNRHKFARMRDNFNRPLMCMFGSVKVFRPKEWTTYDLVQFAPHLQAFIDNFKFPGQPGATTPALLPPAPIRARGLHIDGQEYVWRGEEKDGHKCWYPLLTSYKRQQLEIETTSGQWIAVWEREALENPRAPLTIIDEKLCVWWVDYWIEAVRPEAWAEFLSQSVTGFTQAAQA